MASTLRASALLLPFSSLTVTSPQNPRGRITFSTNQRLARPLQTKLPPLRTRQSLFSLTFCPFAASGDTADTAETENVQEITAEEKSEDGASVEKSENDGDAGDTEERTVSFVMATLQSYKEALANDDQSTVAEIEDILQSLEDEKNSLDAKVLSLSAELAAERERVLRISADFDNFRKRTERERLSLMTNVQGEVVESLLPVLDNFERAKAQIKVETEGEEKINNSYQSIYKQFSEILTSLGVEAVETVGTPFDPLLHEAIMREESTEYEEGVIIQEFRKGFKLGERLLRPAMVKVSAGPGPDKSEEDEMPPADDAASPSGTKLSEEIDEESTEDGGGDSD